MILIKKTRSKTRARTEKKSENKNENPEFSVLITARHNACINRQQVRRHPWRKSLFLQAGQALRRARTGIPARC
jgi:hypothetical protein